MSSNEHEAFIRKLDELDRRISLKEREFKSGGQFSDAHEHFVAGLRARQAELRGKVGDKMKEGVSWGLLGAEFERDFDGLSGELRRWEERMDAAALANRKS
jgi:hypothetical protein